MGLISNRLKVSLLIVGHDVTLQEDPGSDLSIHVHVFRWDCFCNSRNQFVIISTLSDVKTVVFSCYAGSGFNASIRSTFGERQIEVHYACASIPSLMNWHKCWSMVNLGVLPRHLSVFFFLFQDLLLPYFCITTDITSSRMRVHTDGKWCFHSFNTNHLCGRLLCNSYARQSLWI